MFKDFIEDGKVRKGIPDLAKARALIETSDDSIKTIANLEINKTSARTIMSLYYEALREIIEAMCFKEGFKVYSHEALTFFIKEKNEILFSNKFDKFRKIR